MPEQIRERTEPGFLSSLDVRGLVMFLVPALSHCLSVVQVPWYMLDFPSPDLFLFPLMPVGAVSALLPFPVTCSYVALLCVTRPRFSLQITLL